MKYHLLIMNMVRITTVHLILATILMNLEVRIDNLILVIENTVPHGVVFKYKEIVFPQTTLRNLSDETHSEN